MSVECIDAPALAPLPRFDRVRCITILARKELRDAIRHRWFILYTASFAALAIALALVSLAGTGQAGVAGFGRTAAGLVNLVILVVPLMALTAGASSVAGERDRGTLSYLLAQPVGRAEVLLGKYLGLAGALAAALAIGFGASALVIAAQAGAADAATFGRLVGLALALALTMLAVGMLISVLARTGSVAVGTALVVWLALALLGDLGLMGSAVVFRLGVDELFLLTVANPLEAFRMAALGGLNSSLDVLGPSGIYAMQTFGAGLDALFVGVFAAWTAAPLGMAAAVFARRGAK